MVSCFSPQASTSSSFYDYYFNCSYLFSLINSLNTSNWVKIIHYWEFCVYWGLVAYNYLYLSFQVVCLIRINTSNIEGQISKESYCFRSPFELISAVVLTVNYYTIINGTCFNTIYSLLHNHKSYPWLDGGRMGTIRQVDSILAYNTLKI